MRETHTGAIFSFGAQRSINSVHADSVPCKDVAKEIGSESEGFAMNHLEGRLRSLNRLRILKKVRVYSRQKDVTASRRSLVRYLLLDPELHTFSYELANLSEQLEVLASLLGCQTSALQRFADELEQDEVLRECIKDATRFRFESKRMPPLGRHVTTYALTRHIKPSRILELGVHHGLGSLVLLRALEMNLHEEQPGRLTSVDTNPANGWIARKYGSTFWEMYCDSSAEFFHKGSCWGKYDLVIVDTISDKETNLAELRGVQQVSHSSSIVVQSSLNSLFVDLAESRELPYVRLTDRPLGHWSRGRSWNVFRM